MVVEQDSCHLDWREKLQTCPCHLVYPREEQRKDFPISVELNDLLLLARVSSRTWLQKESTINAGTLSIFFTVIRARRVPRELTSFDDDISAFYTMKFKYVWQSNASSIPWLNILEEISQEYGSITILYWRMSWWVQGQKGSLSNIFPGNQILFSLFPSVASLNAHTKILSLFVRQSFFIT